MGEVISIKRSNDNDLFDHFEKACPKVPEDIDYIIGQTAARALGDDRVIDKSSFRNVCLMMGGVCCVGMLLAHGVTTRWNNAVESAAKSSVASSSSTAIGASTTDLAVPQFAAALPAASTSVTSTSVNSWNRSKAAWSEYIARLESDPFYQYVQQEKRRFKSQYPEQ